MLICVQHLAKTRAAVCMLLAVGMLAGCVTTPTSQSTANMSPEERRLHEQAQDFNTTVVQGAVVGAVLGAIAGALLSDNKAAGAAIGAAAGGAIGSAGGYYVAQRKEGYATEQARLDGMIADVDADNQRLTAFISNTRSVIAKNEQELAAMQKEVDAGRKEQSDQQALLAKVEGNRDAIADAVEHLKENQVEYQTASAQMKADTGADTSAMDVEINELTQQIAVLEQELNELNDLIDVHQI